MKRREFITLLGGGGGVAADGAGAAGGDPRDRISPKLAGCPIRAYRGGIPPRSE